MEQYSVDDDYMYGAARGTKVPFNGNKNGACIRRSLFASTWGKKRVYRQNPCSLESSVYWKVKTTMYATPTSIDLAQPYLNTDFKT